MQSGPHRNELSGGFRSTTNNRMELLAVVRGLEVLKQPCAVTVYSDSRYIVDAVNKGWAERWRANGWRRNKKDRAVNPDLWGRLLNLLESHDVEFQWIKDTRAIRATNGPTSLPSRRPKETTSR